MRTKKAVTIIVILVSFFILSSCDSSIWNGIAQGMIGAGSGYGVNSYNTSQSYNSSPSYTTSQSSVSSNTDINTTISTTKTKHPCYTCGGKKVCSVCKGTGQVKGGYSYSTKDKYVTCRTCNGSGVCISCKGLGYHEY